MSHRRRRMATATVFLALVLIVVAPVGGAAQAPAETARQTAITGTLSWLRAQQAADGSFGGSPGSSAEAALAAAAAGEDLTAWRPSGGPSLVDYLIAQADAYASDAATAGKLLTALVAAGRDPHDVGGLDLVARLRSYDDGGGAFSDGALAQAWAVVGLAAAGGPIPQGATSSLIALQQPDGGWEGGAGWGTDSNTTALAVEALVAAGVPAGDPALVRAKAYLRDQLAPSGGFVYSAAWGEEPDANSTAYAIQGLLALGEDPAGETWARSGNTAWDALLAFRVDGGAFEWQAGQGANLLATAQAVPALAGVTYPLQPAETAPPEPIVLEDGQPLSGALVGRRAGAQALYRLAVPGGGQEVIVEVSTPAAHPLVLVGFGFNVYDGAGHRLGGGSVAESVPQQVLRFAATADAPDAWTVQVYNYLAGTPLPYSIVAQGVGTAQGTTPLAGPEAEKGAAPQSDVVPSLDGEVQGTLAGDRAGAYARYRFPVTVPGQDVALRLRFAPDDPSLSAGLGFTVYGPSGCEVPGAPTGTPGERMARIAAAPVGEYMVQVYNYVNGVAMRYTLSR